MAKAQKKRKKPVEKPAQLFQPKDFLDRIAPAQSNSTRTPMCWAGCTAASWPPGYPAATEELALLSHICNRAASPSISMPAR